MRKILNNKYLISVFIVFSILLLAIMAFSGRLFKSPGSNTTCTLEAKLCPDGSTVGRSGPNCEFTTCPTINPDMASNLSPPPTRQLALAKFEIYTNGTKRVFTDRKYHNLDPQLYIDASDPSLIYSYNPKATWGDFFETLPMSLTKDCLTTGTGQEFCTNSQSSLIFTLNGIEKSNTLDLLITNGDFLVVRFD